MLLVPYGFQHLRVIVLIVWLIRLIMGSATAIIASKKVKKIKPIRPRFLFFLDVSHFSDYSFRFVLIYTPITWVFVLCRLCWRGCNRLLRCRSYSVQLVAGCSFIWISRPLVASVLLVLLVLQHYFTTIIKMDLSVQHSHHHHYCC